jgi:hypothetical protein
LLSLVAMKNKAPSLRTKPTTANTLTKPRRRPAKAKAESAASTPETGGTAAAPSEVEVARRAYEIFLDRDGAPGDPVADWLRAERELGVAG